MASADASRTHCPAITHHTTSSKVPERRTRAQQELQLEDEKAQRYGASRCCAMLACARACRPHPPTPHVILKGDPYGVKGTVVVGRDAVLDFPVVPLESIRRSVMITHSNLNRGDGWGRECGRRGAGGMCVGGSEGEWVEA